MDPVFSPISIIKHMTQSLTIPKSTHQILLQDTPGSRTITLEENANLQYVLSFKDAVPNEKSIITFELNGDHSHVDILGLFTGNNSDTVTFETRTIHNANDTYGHAQIKTMLKDRATSDYFGLIRIEKDTQQSDGHLSHDTMLLSKQAKSKSVPALEIEANDVKAGHSASVGQVDEEVIFYLRSRGLSEHQARELMIEGFFESLLLQINDEKIADQLRKTLRTSLL